MATLNDVAAEAGVSSTAVSRYLNNQINLPIETRRRIDAAVAKFDYRPNVLARRLSTGRSESIGLVAPEIANPFFAELAAAIEAEADLYGYAVYLSSTNGNPKKEAAVLRRLSDGHVDGLIMMTNRPNSDGVLASLLMQHENVVLLDEDVPGVSVPRVFVENEQGAYLGVRHLISAGHTEISMVSGPKSLFTVKERQVGFLKAMDEGGLPVRQEWMLFGEYSREFGREAARRLLDLSDRPTAILACSDYLAAGMLQAFRQAGISVPDDISIVGFDDMLFADLLDPPLTTIRQPIAEMGRLAFRHLLAVLNKTGAPPLSRLPVELIVRGSVLSRNKEMSE